MQQLHVPALRKPEASKLTWDGKKKRSRPERPVYLKVNEDRGESGPSKMEGTMVFKNVPTSGIVTFSFGSSGYSGLRLDFGPSTGARGDPWLILSLILFDQQGYLGLFLGPSSVTELR